VSIVGASGYVGGEFLRLALGHPGLRVTQVTSREHAGYPVPIVHPNLRDVTELRFTHPDDLEPADVLVAAMPHGRFAKSVEHWLPFGRRMVVDLSEDFRLASAEAYARFHTQPHANPSLLGSFVPAVPELHRDALEGATRIAGVGCIATATILGLAPVVRARLLDVERDVVVDAKIGSSAAGKELSLASHHSERAGAVRTYAPTRHRHLAEVEQALPGAPRMHMSATAVERVRGVLATTHAFVREGVEEADVLAAFRTMYDAEPFVRIVRARRGAHRVPDPRILDGSNYCDVGFGFDPESRRLVVLSALDNLVKGAAGHALQALNVALNVPERTGLGFTGLHP
jgi:N-acetyl-gamma-glutamyl-phosphate/LysW-gamma-L-alpha-aminoadipyl-6-phosphate reductase